MLLVACSVVGDIPHWVEIVGWKCQAKRREAQFEVGKADDSLARRYQHQLLQESSILTHGSYGDGVEVGYHGPRRFTHHS